MQTPVSFLASVSDATNTAAVGATAAPPPAVEASQVRAVADVAVDALSVSGSTTLGVRFAGVESKLFQASLLPYLVYLWFLAWTRSAPLPLHPASPRDPSMDTFYARVLYTTP